ncbi:hypothetical protein FRB95_006465 [Tulasnella sp. JGI-2019a]|nr:hypothetical protein FRB95_006465 [Tulasnella sp. JGI-2019a]
MSDIEIDAQHPATILAGSPVVEVLTFSGRPDEDVTLFLQNVKRIAFAQGRQKDEGWLADYVETCLAGAALRWFSELEDTAGDQSWKVLRRAFLERFEPVANPQPSAAAPGSSSSSPSASARSLVPQPISSVPHPSSILRTSPSTNTEVMKTILIGDTGVGKSSLLSRILSYGRAPPSIEPTNGVDYETWSGMLGEKKYQRHFWDTSGATQVRALTISFIPDVTSIFLVFDVTNQRSLKCKMVFGFHKLSNFTPY